MNPMNLTKQTKERKALDFSKEKNTYHPVEGTDFEIPEVVEHISAASGGEAGRECISINTSSKLINKFGMNISVEADILGLAKFSQSTEIKQFDSEYEERSRLFTYSFARDDAYGLRLLLQKELQLNESFVGDIKKLPPFNLSSSAKNDANHHNSGPKVGSFSRGNTFTGGKLPYGGSFDQLDVVKTPVVTNEVISMLIQPYDEFIEKYGTHFTKYVLFGGQAFQKINFDYSKYHSLTKRDIDVESHAKASFLATVKVDIETNTSDSKEFQNETEEITESVDAIGGKLSKSDTNLFKWMDTIEENPAPIKVELEEITELFQARYLPDMDASELEQKKKVLAERLKVYYKSKEVDPFMGGIRYRDRIKLKNGGYYLNGWRMSFQRMPEFFGMPELPEDSDDPQRDITWMFLNPDNPNDGSFIYSGNKVAIYNLTTKKYLDSDNGKYGTSNTRASALSDHFRNPDCQFTIYIGYDNIKSPAFDKELIRNNKPISLKPMNTNSNTLKAPSERDIVFSGFGSETNSLWTIERL